LYIRKKVVHLQSLKVKAFKNKDVMTTIKSNTTLTSRSICDYNCIFTLEVIERKGNFATVKYMNNVKRVKVRSTDEGEYIQPDNYSMAPRFKAN
jgi:hypothetical protein